MTTVSKMAVCLGFSFTLTAITHTHPFNGPLSGTTRVSRYQNGKTNLYFTEARDSEWQRHQLGHMQVCTSIQTVNNASTHCSVFLQAGCPSCRPTNSVIALKAIYGINYRKYYNKGFDRKLARKLLYCESITKSNTNTFVFQPS